MGKFCESTYEEAFIDLLEQYGWEYTCGNGCSSGGRGATALPFGHAGRVPLPRSRGDRPTVRARGTRAPTTVVGRRSTTRSRPVFACS